MEGWRKVVLVGYKRGKVERERGFIYMSLTVMGNGGTRAADHQIHPCGYPNINTPCPGLSKSSHNLPWIRSFSPHTTVPERCIPQTLS